MDIATTLRWTAARYPQRIAVGGANPITYAEWDAHTNYLALELLRLGSTPGDRVVLMLQGGEPLASLHLAAQKANLTSVPLSTRLAPHELSHCIIDSSPTLIIIDDITEELVRKACDSIPAPVIAHVKDLLVPPQNNQSLPNAPAESDLSLMLYTAGTTGKPKGVPRTHKAEHSAAVAHLIQTGQPTGAVSLGVMPMFHTMGMRSLLASIISAGTWVPQAKFDADEAIQLIVDNNIDTLYLVPAIYWSLYQTGRLGEARSLKHLAYAGAAMTSKLAEQLVVAVNPDRFVNHYGSTEIYTFSIGPDSALKPGCAGRAGIFSNLRLVDPTPGASPDAIVPPGTQGQIAVSMDSPEAFSGYWNRPDADAKSIREGWYFPGDLATEDDDGDLWISGRVDDMINSGGENLYPEEIERSLVHCPYVENVIVAGTPHDKWGSAVTAFFVPAENADPTESLAQVRGWVRQHSGLPSMKQPKRFIAVETIPTSAVGKILRRRLVDGSSNILADSASEQDPAARSSQ